jgi:hypothetical protein
MKTTTPSYQRHRFPSEIISHAVWLYHRFCLSFREVEELLAERGLTMAQAKRRNPYEALRTPDSAFCLSYPWPVGGTPQRETPQTP